jgi:hypothetical protein
MGDSFVNFLHVHRFGLVGGGLFGVVDPGFVLPGFDVPGLEPGFGLLGLEPGFEVPGFDPGFEFWGFVDPPLGAPGVVGFTFGFGFGFGFMLLGALGFVVELPPGVLGLVGLVGFDPGAVFAPGVLPVGGAVVLPVGGWPVFPVGGVPGDVWPGVPEVLRAPPPGAACATTQVAQKSNTDKSMIFLGDIDEASSLRILLRFLARARERAARARERAARARERAARARERAASRESIGLV